MITIENGVMNGGFGSAVGEALVALRFKGQILRFGWPNSFIPHGSAADLCQRHGLTDEAIAATVLKALDTK
jgi:1-deoxy-D-xylulose-5-phosphate synthase